MQLEEQRARVENAPKKAQLSKGWREAAYPPSAAFSNQIVTPELLYIPHQMILESHTKRCANNYSIAFA